MSLALTLLATPFFDSIFDDITQWLKRRFGSKGTDRGEGELDALDAGRPTTGETGVPYRDATAPGE